MPLSSALVTGMFTPLAAIVEGASTRPYYWRRSRFILSSCLPSCWVAKSVIPARLMKFSYVLHLARMIGNGCYRTVRAGCDYVCSNRRFIDIVSPILLAI
ncbi:hypothetical protein F4777DRAFT_550252 [Nemania sp. FL0916]|nr:hypothetical protein F4777DRAFT_550252 [Nemania sp. FL0916]